MVQNAKWQVKEREMREVGRQKESRDGMREGEKMRAGGMKREGER